MIAVVFALVTAVVYFAVPVAVPSVDLTVWQSVAITLLAYTARLVLFEGVSVEVGELRVVSTQVIEGEDE